MSWPLVKLGDVATVINGRAYNKDELLPAGKYPVLRVGNFFSNRDWYYSDLELDAKNYCDTGDLLYAWSASFGPKIWDEGKVIYHYHIWKLVLNEDKVDKKYLFYFLQRDVEKIKQDHGSGSTMIHITKGAMEERLISLPPLEEQKRIAAILDKADAIRRKRQQAIKLADDFLRSVFLEMFGDPVTNPKKWEVVNIEDVCSYIVDCINKTAKSVDYETPYKMIRTTNVRNMKIDLTDVRYVDKGVYEKWTSRLRPEIGDIVFTREAPAGEAGIIDFDDLVFLGQRTMQFRPDKNRITSAFLLHEMMGEGIKAQMEKMSSGSTVKHLSVPECKKFKVRRPPIELQINFEKLRSKTLSVLELENRAGDISLFESLSQKAFSGAL